VESGREYRRAAGSPEDAAEGLRRVGDARAGVCGAGQGRRATVPVPAGAGSFQRSLKISPTTRTPWRAAPRSPPPGTSSKEALATRTRSEGEPYSERACAPVSTHSSNSAATTTRRRPRPRRRPASPASRSSPGTPTSTSCGADVTTARRVLEQALAAATPPGTSHTWPHARSTRLEPGRYKDRPGRLRPRPRRDENYSPPWRAAPARRPGDDRRGHQGHGAGRLPLSAAPPLWNSASCTRAGARRATRPRPTTSTRSSTPGSPSRANGGTPDWTPAAAADHGDVKSA